MLTNFDKIPASYFMQLDFANLEMQIVIRSVHEINEEFRNAGLETEIIGLIHNEDIGLHLVKREEKQVMKILAKYKYMVDMLKLVEKV